MSAKKTTKLQSRPSFLSRPGTWLGVIALAIIGGWYVLSSHAATPPPVTTTCQNIIVPAYFDPSVSPSLWNQMYTTGTGIKYVIVNPASGPGTSVDPTYVTAIANLRKAGITPLAYVDTSDDAVALSTAEANVRAWKTMYGITDIFIDQVNDTTAALPYYQQLSTYIKTWNPGTTPYLVYNAGDTTASAEPYVSLADQLIIFENVESVYKTTTFPSWTTNPAYTAKLGTIVYGVPSADFNSILSRARSNNIGNIYLTDDANISATTDPYELLPTYLSTEVTATHSGCSTNPTPPANPVVSISSTPANPVAPANVNVTATSNVASNITVSATNINAGPASCSNATVCTYKATNLPVGTYTFTATAVTAAGGSTTTTTTVTVAKPTPPPPPQNNPPTVSLSSSAKQYGAPATIGLTAISADSDGTITQVKILDSSGNVLGTSTNTNYFLIVNNYAIGTYTFTAQATDNSGATTTSAPITVTVVAPTPPPPISSF